MTAPAKTADPIRDIPHYLRVFQTYLGRRMYLIFALTLMAALLEGFGIVMLLPLLQGLDAGFSNAGGPDSHLAGVLQGILGFLGVSGSMVSILLVIATAFLLKGVVTFAAHALKAYLEAQLQRELKARLYNDYSRMGYSYYVARDTGHFINVINGQIPQMIGAFQSLVMLGTTLVTTAIYAALAFVVAWRFGLMAAILGVAILFLFRYLNLYVRNLSRLNSLESGVLAKLLVQALHAFKYLTATGQAEHLRRHVMTSIRLLTGYRMRTGIANSFTSSVREPIAVVFITAIVLVQIAWLQQPLAPIIVAILLFYRGLNSTLSLQGFWQRTLSHIGAVEMVRDEFSAQHTHREQEGSLEIGPLTHGIELRGVGFAYNVELGNVLTDISIEIPAFSSVALVGESGAGKSTLVDILTLMLKPQTGEVLIDGTSGNEIKLDSWRRQIGYVSQETVVFNDTIANNICMWQGDPTRDEILMERIAQAARQAHIAHFIEGLPEGYQTLVGDRGVRLSGGQRQRLFIARELFRRPRLLILDEATSALDTESERYIQQSIDALRGRVTLVIIAHRLATIRNVDRVYVVDRGRIVEQGAYEALRDDLSSRFSKMVASQKL